MEYVKRLSWEQETPERFLFTRKGKDLLMFWGGDEGFVIAVMNTGEQVDVTKLSDFERLNEYCYKK